MARRDKKEFTRRPHNSFLYKWKPDTEIRKNKQPKELIGNVGCAATPSSQGYDNDVKYVYEIININGVLNRLGYVACDYVG